MPSASAIPAATVAGQPAQVGPAATTGPLVHLRNDVLDLQLNGQDVVRAELLQYRQTRHRDEGKPPDDRHQTGFAGHGITHSCESWAEITIVRVGWVSSMIWW